jgi:hypothetical protein
MYFLAFNFEFLSNIYTSLNCSGFFNIWRYSKILVLVLGCSSSSSILWVWDPLFPLVAICRFYAPAHHSGILRFLGLKMLEVLATGVIDGISSPLAVEIAAAVCRRLCILVVDIKDLKETGNC